MGHKFSEEEVEEILTAADVNGDGQLDYEGLLSKRVPNTERQRQRLMLVYGDTWEWGRRRGRGRIFKRQGSVTIYFNGIQFDAADDTAAAVDARCGNTLKVALDCPLLSF